ncbi:MAG: hypothetical protein IMF05_16990 [Proteobacteria bacterium]|nr:hypothetical protein [Pseudomonadota bacterium]
MDVETRALLIGLSRTLSKLSVNLVEEGAMDSNRAVRSFRDFAKSLGEEPHDQATRLWVNHLVETLEANPSSAKHLPRAINLPMLPVERIGSGQVMYVPVDPAETPATVTFSSEFTARFQRPDYSETRDDLVEAKASGGYIF